jgi:hypothetical protein
MASEYAWSVEWGGAAKMTLLRRAGILNAIARAMSGLKISEHGVPGFSSRVIAAR